MKLRNWFGSHSNLEQEVKGQAVKLVGVKESFVLELETAYGKRFFTLDKEKCDNILDWFANTPGEEEDKIIIEHDRGLYSIRRRDILIAEVEIYRTVLTEPVPDEGN